MNRAANSISLNIAEGSGKKSTKHFDLYLDNAVGSTFEVVAGGFRALDEGYIDQPALDTLYTEGETLAKSINDSPEKRLKPPSPAASMHPDLRRPRRREQFFQWTHQCLPSNFEALTHQQSAISYQLSAIHFLLLEKL